jgi:hypothetical protein|nr:hypothetical protein [uncultured Steroidobacter sp.]
MSCHRKFAVLMLMSIAPMFAMAQTTQPPPSTNEPSAASTPHQQRAMHDQMMKECMKRERQKDTSMSKDQVKRNCENQMKMQEQQQQQPRD